MGGKKGFTPEQIIGKLREAEILLGKGASVSEACRKIGVTDVTFYRWRKEYSGLQVVQAKRLKEVEQENTRLRKLVSDLSLENAILKEAAKEKHEQVSHGHKIGTISILSRDEKQQGKVIAH